MDTLFAQAAKCQLNVVKGRQRLSKKIGIYSGVFDPIHEGHIKFALSAIKKAGLDAVYFLVEAKPRRKTDVTHLAHRTAMIKLAIKPHKELAFLDLPDKQFSIAKTWPRLKQKLPGSELFFLMGSDTFDHLESWPLISNFLKNVSLVVALRQSSDPKIIETKLKELSIKPIILNSPMPAVSAKKIRTSIGSNKKPDGLSPKIHDYIKSNWLYVSVTADSSSAS